MNDLSFLKHLRAWQNREFGGNIFLNEAVGALLFIWALKPFAKQRPDIQ